MYVIIIYSIKLVSLVNKFLNNKKSLSNEILNNKSIYQDSFLRGLYSGDGSACISISYRKSKDKWRIEPKISLAVCNEGLINQIVTILISKGYEPCYDKCFINLNKSKDIKKFDKEIRFIEGGKIAKSNYWKGFTKNQVLNYIANYIGKDDHLRNLKKEPNKNDIITHIKRNLTYM